MSSSPLRAAIVALAIFCLSLVLVSHDDKPDPSGSSAAPQPSQSVTSSKSLAVPPPRVARPALSAIDCERLQREISSGRPLLFTARGTIFKPIYFRPTTVTTEKFQATLGSDASESLEIETQEVFSGRSLLGGQQASLAIVNGRLAAHVRQADGSIRHFRSNPETGQLESILEQRGETNCSIDPTSQVATTHSIDSLPADPWSAAEPASIEPDPEIAASSGYNPANGNLQFTDRPIPYGRAYDQSLKDILVLVVLDKSATGGASSGNLSSKTATYLSLMANISAMYENNLGLRIIVQEIILTPNTSDYDDVANGTGTLSNFRSWIGSHRARGTYRWTVATKFGAVEGDRTLGIAYVSAAAGSNGVSINKTGNVNTPAHEIGHNIGSGHSNGGVMNPSINGSRSFFNDLENQSRTSAWAIYNYMSNGGAGTQSRAFPSNRKLRHAEQIPFAADDNVSTLPNQAVRFRPMANDDRSVRNGSVNELTLVEAGKIFPPGAGEAWVHGDEIEFRPAPGFDGTAWLSYTIRGSVGNSGQGWLHKGDVAIRIDGSRTIPPNINVTTTNPDFIHNTGSGAVVINPLVDDHGLGNLNANHTTPTLGLNGSSPALTNGFFISGATLLDTDKGTLARNRVDITLSGGSRVDLIRQLTFTPSAGASGPARIQYTVTDGNGDSTTEIVTVLLGIEETLLEVQAASRYKVPSNDSEASTWAVAAFDDSSWKSGDTGIGYENNNSGARYDSLIDSDTRAGMFNAGTSLYIRVPFEVTDPDGFQNLRLEMQYDDGFAALINGVNVQSRNAPDPTSWDGIATGNHEAELDSFSSYDISNTIGNLEAGTNLLAIHGFNASADSSDFIIRPRLVAVAKFSLGGIALPKEINIPSGVGLELKGFLRGIDEPPFANAASVQWSTLTAGVVFADLQQASTTATFPKPGTHRLRMRVSEAGFVEEHELTVHVGQPSNIPGPLALAGPDLIIAADGSHQLEAIAANADQFGWSQVDGPSAEIAPDGDISFTETGTHTFRFSVTRGKLTTFDDVTIVRGNGRLAVSPLGSLARHLVPNSADDLSDAADESWPQPAFDDADWPLEPALYGFEHGAGYQDLFQVDLQETMNETNATLLVRLPFFAPTASPLRLALRFEDGFAASLNGTEVASENRPDLPLTWNAAADGQQADADALTPETFTAGTTSIGNNFLAIHGLNSSTTSSDFLLLPELSIEVTAAETPFHVQLVNASSAARFLAPIAPTPDWASPGYDDTEWDQTAAAIGYERSGNGNFDKHFFTDIEGQSYDQNETTYLRIPFLLPLGFEVTELSLRCKYDDAFVAYLNGVEVARREFVGNPTWNSGASGARTEALTTVFETIPIDASIQSLEAGANVLAVQLINAGTTSSDLLLVPELVAGLQAISGTAYDQWFESQDGSLGQDASPEADLDVDRLNNLLEFAFGGSPTKPETSAISPSVTSQTFTYRRRVDHQAAGLSYSVETSSNLRDSTWAPVINPNETISATASPQIEQVSIPITETGERRFYRLRVELE